MKKLLLLFIFLYNSSFAQTTVFRYDSTLVESGFQNEDDCSNYREIVRGISVVTNSDSSHFTMLSNLFFALPFLNGSKEIYQFDANRKITSVTYQLGDSLNWKNSRKDNISYDTFGNINCTRRQLWSDFHSTFVDYNLDSTYFSSTGQTLRTAQYNWDTLSSTWIIQNSLDCTFNAAGKVLQRTTMQFSTSGTISGGYDSQYTYDVNDRLLSLYTTQFVPLYSYWKNLNGEEHNYDVAGNDTLILILTGDSVLWMPSARHISTYNGSGMLTMGIYSSWTAGVWTDVSQIQREYNIQELDSIELHQDWDGTNWINSTIRFTSYSLTNKVAQNTFQTWVGNTWVNTENDQFTYDSADSLIETLYSAWNNGNWEMQSREIYTYYSYFPLSYYNAGQDYDPSSGWISYSESSVSFDSTGNLVYFWYDGHAGISGGEMHYAYYPDGMLSHEFGYECTMGGLGKIVDRYFYHLMQVDLQIASAIICRGDSLSPAVSVSGDNPPYSFSWSPGTATSDSTIQTPYLFPELSANFSLTATDDSGSVSIRQAIASVSEIPAPILGNDTLICSGSVFQLNAGNQFSSYEWQDGSTQASFFVNTSTAGVFDFWITAQDSNQCLTHDTITITVDPCNDVENIKATDFNIYPNPAKDEILLVFKNELSHDCTISIINSNGKEFPLKKLNDTPTTFQLNFSSDIYFIKSVSETGVELKKLVIER